MNWQDKNNNEWQRITSNNLPPENVEVMTKIDDEMGERNVCTLCLRDRMWWTGTDGNAMYIYYNPTHWKWKDNKS